MGRRLIAWLFGVAEPTRLEALRIIERAEVIRPPRKAVPFLNLRLVRGPRRRRIA